MKLTTALKEKNKLTKRISELEKIISQHNSDIKGNDKQFDVNQLLTELDTVTADLVKIKGSISEANQPINKFLIEMGEIRSQIAFLKKINVKDGQTSERYGTTIVSYEAQLKQADIMKLVKTKEEKIEKLQELVEQHNFTTEI